MTKYTYSYFKSRQKSKNLNTLIRKYMNYIKRVRQLKSFVICLLLVALVSLSLILLASHRQRAEAGSEKIAATYQESEALIGEAGIYKIPSPCTLKDVYCKKDEIVLRVVESSWEKKEVKKATKVQVKPKVVTKAKILPNTKPVKKGASKQTQERINYAWSISHNKDFIFTIEAENKDWSTKTVGITGDKGICQISPYFHPDIVNNPKFKDWKWQIDQCWKLYKGGTRFYGYDVRYKVVNRFTMATIK